MLYEFKDWVDFDVIVEGDDDVRFSALFTQFNKPVRLVNCTVRQLELNSAYFLQGLEITGCRVLCEVAFPWGGHNRRPIRIEDCEFEQFVDVEDCLFEAEVSLRNVRFQKGTNLLGNVGTPVEVHFGTPLRLDSVEGQLDRNTYQRYQPGHPSQGQSGL